MGEETKVLQENEIKHREFCLGEISVANHEKKKGVQVVLLYEICRIARRSRG